MGRASEFGARSFFFAFFRQILYLFIWKKNPDQDLMILCFTRFAALKKIFSWEIFLSTALAQWSVFFFLHTAVLPCLRRCGGEKKNPTAKSIHIHIFVGVLFPCKILLAGSRSLFFVKNAETQDVCSCPLSGSQIKNLPPLKPSNLQEKSTQLNPTTQTPDSQLVVFVIHAFRKKKKNGSCPSDPVQKIYISTSPPPPGKKCSRPPHKRDPFSQQPPFFPSGPLKIKVSISPQGKPYFWRGIQIRRNPLEGG